MKANILCISSQVLCFYHCIYYLQALNLKVLLCSQDRSPGEDDFVLFFDELSGLQLLVSLGGGASATFHGARHICRDNSRPNCSGGAATFFSGNLTAVVFLASIICKYPVRIIHTFFICMYFEFIQLLQHSSSVSWSGGRMGCSRSRVKR